MDGRRERWMDRCMDGRMDGPSQQCGVDTVRWYTHGDGSNAATKLFVLPHMKVTSDDRSPLLLHPSWAPPV